MVVSPVVTGPFRDGDRLRPPFEPGGAVDYRLSAMHNRDTRAAFLTYGGHC